MSEDVLRLLTMLALRAKREREQLGMREAVQRRLKARMSAAFAEFNDKLRNNDLPPSLFVNHVAYPVESASRLLADALDRADMKEAAE